MAVANITELSNSVTLGNLLSAEMAPAFVKAAVGLDSVYLENLPVGTNVKKFTKAGSLTAATLAESTALAVDANGELTDSSISLTAAKCAVSSGLSVEEEQFGFISLDRIGQEQGAAIGRFVSDDILSLAGGFSTNTVTCATVATVDDLMLAQFAIYNAKVPNPEISLNAILGPRAVYNIKKDIVQSGASVWSNPNMLTLLSDGKPAANGLMGAIPGICNVYMTTGFGTSGGDDVQMVVHPRWALCGMLAPAPKVWIKQKGSEGAYTEVFSFLFYDVGEWNDAAGCKFSSDT